ncbi:hypothetical protein [Nocardioides sp. Root151]|uniref:hypothetical protein n=1 Tax=Nocardioides sp. Root151 TaxID=1736475 RepID=UPI0012E3F3DF|nr:hypothetical protein [Nocardioides sp. Root151]
MASVIAAVMSMCQCALAVAVDAQGSPAGDPCDKSAISEVVHAEATLDAFALGGETSDTSNSCPTRAPTPEELMKWALHGAACASVSVATDGDTGDVCQAPPQQQITQVMVLRALQRITLPKPAIVIQPPGGKTLVNFETIFHTDAKPFVRSVRLLGIRVDLEITPTSYTWTHGDGTTQTTSGPGVAFDASLPMTAYVSHEYVDAHVTVKPQVSTTYSARFRVRGGPWRDVSGTVTSEGSSVPLRVVEGKPTLVDGP